MPSPGPLLLTCWYSEQVLSCALRVAWPCVVAIIALRIVSFPLPRGWNPTLVPAPGVSLLDALVFLWAGYYGSHRTGRFITGVVLASVTSLVGFTTFFIYAAVTSPSLLLSPFEKPFIFVIVATLLGLALGFAVAAGIVGAAVGRWLPPSYSRARAS